MASVASAGTSSPMSGYDVLGTESTGDTDESWQYIDLSAASASNPASLEFFPSTASGSLAGYAIVGQQQPHAEGSPVPLSPFFLDVDQTGFQAPVSSSSLAEPQAA